MVEQICEKCGARYSLYAPACPSCGEASTAPEKVPGCPQAPAAPKPAPKPKKAEKPAEAPAEEVCVVEACSCPCGPLAVPIALAAVCTVVAVIATRLLRR